MCCKLKFSLLLLPLILEALIELKDLCWLYFVCYCDWSLILSPTLLSISHFIHRTLFLWNHDSDQLKALGKCLRHVADVSQVLSVLLQLKNIGLWLWWRIALKLYLSVCKCCSQELDYYYNTNDPLLFYNSLADSKFSFELERSSFYYLVQSQETRSVQTFGEIFQGTLGNNNIGICNQDGQLFYGGTVKVFLLYLLQN